MTACEILNPVTGLWRPVGALSRNRGPRGVLLADGRVLAASGTSAETFDPTLETWTLTPGSPIEPRGSYALCRLADGRVLLAGGHVAVGPVTTAGAELFDPITNTFTATLAMNAQRQQFAMVLLASGQALAIGGVFGGGSHLDSAELFTAP